MKKNLRISAIILSLLLFTLVPINAYATDAAPASTLVQMKDGGYFDPAFFAATYPDLVAQIGTDTNAMYQHYLKFGQCQGLKPFADGAAQSLTYQPGSIVVPASIKKHPEARDTLVYSDANVDIFYNCTGAQSWIDGRDPTLAIVFDIKNKTNGDLSIYADNTAINGQMQYCLLSSTIFAGASAKESADFMKYPDSEFKNLNSATLELHYNASSVSDKYQTVRFNMIFYH